MDEIPTPLGPVRLPERYVSKVCNLCNAAVGGRTVGEGFPPLPPLPEPEAMCPYCGTNDLRWGDEATFAAPAASEHLVERAAELARELGGE